MAVSAIEGDINVLFVIQQVNECLIGHQGAVLNIDKALGLGSLLPSRLLNIPVNDRRMIRLDRRDVPLGVLRLCLSKARDRD
jgi:hypothetical protein